MGISDIAGREIGRGFPEMNRKTILVGALVAVAIIALMVLPDRPEPPGVVTTPEGASDSTAPADLSTPGEVPTPDAGESAAEVRPIPARPVSQESGKIPVEASEAGVVTKKPETQPVTDIPVDDAGALRQASRVHLCRAGFFTAEQIQQDIDRRSAQSAWDGSISMIIRGKSRQFDNLANYEAWLWSSHDECEEFKSREETGFRAEVLSAAREGNVYARYLYAMWPPAEIYANAAALMEYQELALDFTWKNIEQGEPLGMLAMGHSYWLSGRAALFTPHSAVLSRVFLVAAVLCGVDHRWIEREVGFKVSQFAPGAAESSPAMTELNLAADTLRRQYCD